MPAALFPEIRNLAFHPDFADLHFQQVLHPPQKLRHGKRCITGGLGFREKIHAGNCGFSNWKNKSASHDTGHSHRRRFEHVSNRETDEFLIERAGRREQRDFPAFVGNFESA